MEGGSLLKVLKVELSTGSQPFRPRGPSAPSRRVCTLQAPAPAAQARGPGLCQAGCSVARWEGGEARKHRVPRAGCKAIVLETDAWKYQGPPQSTGKAAGRKVVTVRKQVWTRAGDLTLCTGPARPRPPRPAPALIRVSFQRCHMEGVFPADASCLIINEPPVSSAWSCIRSFGS